MEIMNAKFLDSLNYLHMPLSALPKAYGLTEIEKGTFPHLFNPLRTGGTVFSYFFNGIILYENGCKENQDRSLSMSNHLIF